ncbi:MAG: hypothetical protein Q9224_007371, partial [Gallowayella concinna]
MTNPNPSDFGGPSHPQNLPVPFRSGNPNPVGYATEAIQERRLWKRAAEEPISLEKNSKKPKLIIGQEQGDRPNKEYLSSLRPLDLHTVGSEGIRTEPDGNPPVKAPFPYTQIPTTAHKSYCAFGDLTSEKPWLVGEIGPSSLKLSTFFIVNASRLGMPNLTLAIRVEDHTSKGTYETAYFNWYAQAPDHNGALQVQEFQYQSFDTWLEGANEKSKALAVTKREQSEKKYLRLMVISCRLQLPIFTNFKDSSLWNTIPSELFNKIEGFFNRSRRLDFLIASANNKVVSIHLPLFSRHMEEKLGMLSQYRDPETNCYNLYKIKEIQELEAIGAGMYLQEDGGTLKMPKMYYFHFPVQFQVFTALVPIREAQARGEINQFQMQLSA